MFIKLYTNLGIKSILVFETFNFLNLVSFLSGDGNISIRVFERFNYVK